MSTIVNDLVSYLQCGEAIAQNDAIYIDDVSGKIFKYDATDDTQVFAGIAKEAGILNDYVRVVQSGRIKGFSGLTAGAFVYASTTTPGGFQLVEPAASQKVILGIAKSATELVINGGLGIKPGGDGGGGGLDVYYIENMEALADVSDFSTGNNAAFMGGGTMQGTLALDEVSPISGTKSLTYTQAAGSLNDYFASELIDIDLKQQNNDSGMTLYFQYDGNDNDLKFVVYDVTNGAELTSGVELVKVTDKAQRYALSFYVPVTCTQIRWGAQVLVENIGAVLEMDDVEITSNPFVYKDLIDEPVAARYTSDAGQAIPNSTVTVVIFEDNQGDTHNAMNTSTGEYTVPVSGWYQINSQVGITGLTADVGNFASAIRLNGSDISVNDDGINRANTQGSNNSIAVHLDAGDIIDVTCFHTNGASRNLAATAQRVHFSIERTPEPTEHVITPAKSSRVVVRGAGNGGEVITANVTDIPFTEVEDDLGLWDGSSFTADSDGDYIIGGSISFDSASTSTVDIYIDGVQTNNVKITEAGSGVNPLSTIIRLNKGQSLSLRSGSTRTLVNNVNGHYIHIQKISDEATLLAAIPTPKTAYIKDVKPSGTPGGTFTAGAWQTRDLNTLEGDTGFVSLSGNQFTLQPGKYEIEASAPARNNSGSIDFHKAKLRNITDSTDSIIGSSEYLNIIDAAGQSSSTVKGSITLTSSKTFEIQHRCQTTQATNGFGQASSFGVDEIYTQVSIKKIS